MSAQRRTLPKPEQSAPVAAPQRVVDAARPANAPAQADPARTGGSSGRPPKPAAPTSRPPKPAAPAARPPKPAPASSRPPKPVGAEGRPPKPTADGGRPPKPADRAITVPQSGARGMVATRTAGIRRLYADTLSEMRKVNWPDRETTKNLTLVVIAVSIVLGILLGGVDFVLQALFEALP